MNIKEQSLEDLKTAQAENFIRQRELLQLIEKFNVLKKQNSPELVTIRGEWFASLKQTIKITQDIVNHYNNACFKTVLYSVNNTIPGG